MISGWPCSAANEAAPVHADRGRGRARAANAILENKQCMQVCFVFADSSKTNAGTDEKQRI